MSIFTPILRPLIIREVKNMMKDMKPAAAIVMQAIEKFGTKFVLALGAVGGIGYLTYMDKVEGWIGVLGMVLVAVGYFYARRQQEKDVQTCRGDILKPVTTLLGAFLVILMGVSGAVAQERASLYGVMAGSVLGVDDFAEISGGAQLGTSVSLDSDKGLFLRTLYTKASWGDLDFESISIAPMLTWYAGKRWDFYVVFGRAMWEADGETGGDTFAGLGTSRRIYTGASEGYAVPFTVDAFIDFTSDNIGPYGDAHQVTLGFQFSKPVKK